MLSLMLHGANAPILYVFFVVPVVCSAFLLLLLFAAIRKRPCLFVSALLAVVGFAAISWVLERNEARLRPSLRWFLLSPRYKTELMAQPGPPTGELKHSVWDTWGFVPSGFTIPYLVFDPADSLANVAKSKAPVRFSGIPCEVPQVLRLEKQWYAVRFYTDEDWRNCASSGTSAHQQ